jgi:hypothetical protein
LEYLKLDEAFQRWTRSNYTGSPCPPLELLLLGALRILGQDDTSNCIAELANISGETHHQFFRKFILFGSTVLFQKYVICQQQLKN